MADDDESRRPPQAYATVSPAEVGTTTGNQVSPGTIEEILDTGDQSLIDQALDQLTANDLTRYSESLASPPNARGLFHFGWVVKLLEPPPREHKHRIVGVPVYLQERKHLVVGVALDCWQPWGLVVMVILVVVVMIVAPSAEDPDVNADADGVVVVRDVLNRPPRYHGRLLDPLSKSHLEDHPEP